MGSRTGARARRRRGALLLGGVMVVSVAGCAPVERPLVAVYADREGTAQVLLRSCDEDGRVRGPILEGTPTGDPGGGAAEEASVGWVGWEARGEHRAADFPLFAPPSDWDAEFHGIRELRPGHSYRLAFGDPDDSYAYTGTVSFDAERLARVPDGEVLTLDGTVSREAFEEQAREVC
ncbi:hypothetical protein [Streptomyces sp. NPDC046887]|uniref:hypothetical protein n=1 Tax=Streptomyces sp. NPDC046887 TaxID=3155472 RepID=UPI0033E71261